MARSTTVQSSVVAGILGAETQDRTDVEEYYNGARDLLNVDPRPGGGFQLRPGLAHYGPLRRVLASIDLAAATITFGAQLAPGGGTAPSPPPPPSDPQPYPDLPPWTPRSDLKDQRSD